jgi:hypothetical protein
MVDRPIQISSQNTISFDHIVNLNENVFIPTKFVISQLPLVRFDRPVYTLQHIRDARSLTISMRDRLIHFHIG